MNSYTARNADSTGAREEFRVVSSLNNQVESAIVGSSLFIGTSTHESSRNAYVVAGCWRTIISPSSAVVTSKRASAYHESVQQLGPGDIRRATPDVGNRAFQPNTWLPSQHKSSHQPSSFCLRSSEAVHWRGQVTVVKPCVPSRWSVLFPPCVGSRWHGRKARVYNIVKVRCRTCHAV